MAKMHTLYIFTRDLRIEDNTTLNAVSGDVVYPLFILNPEQLEGEYASVRAINFMFKCIYSLSRKIPLTVLKGEPYAIIAEILKAAPIQRVCMNKDYSPFAKKRESRINEICTRAGVQFLAMHDYLLTEFTDDPYLKFTPFYKSISRVPKPVIKEIHFTRLPFTKYTYSIPAADDVYAEVARINLRALKIPAQLIEPTSHLSKYLKFGVISPRAVYHGVKDQEIKRQLLWRDFYMLIMHKHEGKQMRAHGKWNNKNFEKWRDGKTGVPIVDACMNELNSTGFISNRARLIVADYLINHLNVDWRLGEKHFARQLIDYDISINGYNWQWVLQNGTTRRLSPERQTLRFDRKHEYIKRWA